MKGKTDMTDENKGVTWKQRLTNLPIQAYLYVLAVLFIAFSAMHWALSCFVISLGLFLPIAALDDIP